MTLPYPCRHVLCKVFDDVWCAQQSSTVIVKWLKTLMGQFHVPVSKGLCAWLPSPEVHCFRALANGWQGRILIERSKLSCIARLWEVYALSFLGAGGREDLQGGLHNIALECKLSLVVRSISKTLSRPVQCPNLCRSGPQHMHHTAVPQLVPSGTEKT